MKKIIIILSFLAFFCSCSKKQVIFDKNHTGINFFYKQKEKNVNFLFYPESQKKVEIKIPLRIVGVPKNKDRYYYVSIVTVGKDKTTAKEGIHYKKLEEKYRFKKNLSEDTLRIFLFRPKKNESYKLTIKLTKSDDFELGIKEDNKEDKSTYSFFKESSYYRQQLTIYAGLDLKKAPEFWTFYEEDEKGNYYFAEYNVGPYHYKKVQKFIELAKIKNEKWRYVREADMLWFIRQTKDWFERNKRFDETGNRLWFEDKLIFDGTNDYDNTLE
jgi:hypothetical protein